MLKHSASILGKSHLLLRSGRISSRLQCHFASSSCAIVYQVRPAVQQDTVLSVSSLPNNREKISVVSKRALSTEVLGASSHNSSAKAENPQLKKIPSVPFLGSNFTPVSGIDSIFPYLEKGNFLEYWRKLYRENGPFFTVGLPGLGSGMLGTLYVLRSPEEMLKVIHAEGSFPGGGVQNIWPSLAWLRKANFSSIGLFKQGEEWKRIRSFLQKDLLAPQSAKAYMPSIVEATKYSSQRLRQDPEMKKDLNQYLNFCSADMFLYVTFGQGATSEDDQVDYDEFVRRAVRALGSINELMLNPLEMFAHYVGLKTPGLNRFCDMNDSANELAANRVQQFLDRAKRGDEFLTESEKNCYLYKMMKRQPESGVTEKELLEIAFLLMTAAVDTTASKTAWNLVQLAIHQGYQDKLRYELEKAIDANNTGGELTADVFINNQVPLLSAFIRESFRCTPESTASLLKPIQRPVELHGTTVPAGSRILFDSMTNMMDPNLIDDPLSFRPERWLKASVEARKNTPKEIVDHPFYSGPFSQGARRCPGSRVSYLEIQAILARLILDYKIEGPANMHWSDIQAKLHLLVNPVFPAEVKLVPRN